MRINNPAGTRVRSFRNTSYCSGGPDPKKTTLSRGFLAVGMGFEKHEEANHYQF